MGQTKSCDLTRKQEKKNQYSLEGKKKLKANLHKGMRETGLYST